MDRTDLDRDTETAVITSLAAMLQRAPDTITTDLRFFEDLSFDSTSVLELLMQLEDDLNLEFDPEELEPGDFETVGTLVAYVNAQSGN